MSDHANHHPENSKPSNPIKTAVAVAVGAFAMIVGIILLTRFAIGTHEIGATVEAVKSPAEIAKRIAPAAYLAVDPTKGAAPVATLVSATATAIATPATPAAPIVAMAIPAPVAAGTAPAAGGEGVFNGACVACHGAGIAGAPKSGDKAAWAPRIAQGKPTLYEHAIKGYQGKAGVMPAKGGNSALADADVKAAVDYMVAVNK